MFHKSKSLLITTLDLMVNHTEKRQLMVNIYDALHSISDPEIDDEYLKRVFKTAVKFSDVLMDKGIKNSQQALTYFEELNIDDDIKSIIRVGNYQPDEILSDFSNLYAKVKFQSKVKRTFNRLEDAYNEYMISGVSDVKEATSEMLERENELSTLMTEIRESVSEKESVLISTNPDIKDRGVNQLKEDFQKSVNRMKTGMWMDHVTGGGFKCGKSYIVGSISGGFKSGFMQNMAEFMSIANKPADLKVPSGYAPYILYINLEMDQTQMTERRASFYGIDKNDLRTSNKEIDEQIKDKLKEFGSDIPVMYQKETAREYSYQQLNTDMQHYEREGLKCVALIFDYSDLLKYRLTPEDEAERIAALVRKNEQLRSIASKFKIPVITGIQLNRASSEIKRRLAKAATHDILRDLSSDSIAKAFDVINVPEQIYFCYKATIYDKDYFSLLVEKDRDGDAKFIDTNGTERSPEWNRVHYVSNMDGFRIGNDYRSTIRDFNLVDNSIVTAMEMTEEEVKAMNGE